MPKAQPKSKSGGKEPHTVLVQLTVGEVYISNTHRFNSSHSTPPTDPSAPVEPVAAAVAVALVDWLLGVAEQHSLQGHLDNPGFPVSRSCNPVEQAEVLEVEAAVANQVVVDFVAVSSAADGVML